MPLIVDFLFAIGQVRSMSNSYQPYQILSYVGAILSVIATVVLGYLVLKQNENLHDINTKLQEQNLRISKDSRINESYNFLKYLSIEICTKSYVRVEYVKPCDAIELKYDGGGDTGPFEMNIKFYGKEYRDSPIREIKLKSLKLNFDIYATGVKRVFNERFSFDGNHVAPVINQDNDNEFVIRCHIPYYYYAYADVMKNQDFLNLQIEVSVEYISHLDVCFPVKHTLVLDKKDDVNGYDFVEYEVINDQRLYGKINVD